MADDQRDEVEDVRSIVRVSTQIGIISQREIGRQTGISVSNINRFIAGHDLSLAHYMTLRAWAIRKSEAVADA